MLRSSRNHRLLLCLAMLFCATPTFAWNHDLISQPTQVAVTPSGQSDYLSPNAAIADGNGGVFVPFYRSNSLSGYDIVVQHMSATGAPVAGWPAAGITVYSATNTRFDPHVVLDGAGGVLVFWLDSRSGVTQVFGQRLNASGVKQWAASGVLMQAADGFARNGLVATSDGTGGAWIAYQTGVSASDLDVYGAHVLGNGTYTQLYFATPGGIQWLPAIAPDGSGGAYVAWEDDQGVNGVGYEIRLSRVTSSNTLAFSAFAASSNLPGNQSSPVLLSDGGTGVFVAWLGEASPSVFATFALRISSAGTLIPGWPTGGAVIHKLSGYSDYIPTLVLDGSGGCFFVTQFASAGAKYGAVTHVSGSGVFLPGSQLTGAVCTESINLSRIGAIADGNGGLFALFADYRTQQVTQPAVVHVTSACAIAPGSVHGGRPVASFFTSGSSIVSDAKGGSFVIWNDDRTGLSSTYAARLDRYGYLGDASPTSAGVKDIPGDQGGAVRVNWNASWMDGDPDTGISSYWIWRQAPLTIANAAVRNGDAAWTDGESAIDAAALVHARSESGASMRLFQHDAASASPYAWELVATPGTNGSAKYSYVASTTTDSTAGHNPYTVFMVEARSALDSRVFWQTAPDSGYSVDNLPPFTPAPFTAQYVAGRTSLQWGANSEADLAGYRLYRGSSLGFVPNAANRIVSQSGTAYIDVAGAPYYYKLTAVDAHGNESPAALVQPSGTLAVDDAAPHALAFALASGNPARGSATLRFALPSASRVRIALYDAAGREVRMLADGAFEAGTFTRAWDGTDASGAAAPSGLYFARLATEGRVLSTRFVLTR